MKITIKAIFNKIFILIMNAIMIIIIKVIFNKIFILLMNAIMKIIIKAIFNKIFIFNNERHNYNYLKGDI